jgi:hypothetical protein
MNNVMETTVITDIDSMIMIYNREVMPRVIDFEKYRSKFAWLPSDIIRYTFENSTQFYRKSTGTHLKKTYRSPFPACNVHQRSEGVATDTVYAETPAIDDGATIAQFFVDTDSLVCDVYSMKTDKQFVNALQDNIQHRGAMTKLISDHAQVEISKKVEDILRHYIIGDWQSEPHYQHQNPTERR